MKKMIAILTNRVLVELIPNKIVYANKRGKQLTVKFPYMFLTLHPDYTITTNTRDMPETVYKHWKPL